MTAAAQPQSAPPSTPRRRSRWARFRLTRAERKGLRTGLLFISPWLVGFLAFTLYPALASLYYSFTDFKILQSPRWIGLDNYASGAQGPRVLEVAGQHPVPDARRGPARRSSWPSGSPSCSTTGRIRGLGGLPDDLLPAGRDPGGRRRRSCASSCSTRRTASSTRPSAFVGIDGPRWFFDPAWAKNGLILLTVWAAGDVVIIYLGALQGVSRTLYEAAEVDGAGAWVKLRHVTIPMISPAILFNLIVGAIAAFQSFTQAYVISKGVSRAANDALDRRRPELPAPVRPQPLQQGVPLLPDGLRVGARLGPAARHPARDRVDAARVAGTASTTRASDEGRRDAAGRSRRRRRAGAGPGRWSIGRRWWCSSCSRPLYLLPLRLDDHDLAQDGAAVDRVPAGRDPEPARLLGVPGGHLEDELRRGAPEHPALRRAVGHRHPRLVQPRRLRVRHRQVAGPRHRVRDRARDDDAADPGHVHPAVRHLREAGLDQHLPAAHHPDVPGHPVLHLPAAPVLPGHPASTSSMRRASTARASCGS